MPTVIGKKESIPTNPKILEQKKKDSKIVKGKFVWMECPGGTLEFHYKKYPGEKVKYYKLTDGYEYELPLGVVKHLLGCEVEESTHDVKLVDPNTYQPLYDVKKSPRFAFVTSEYIDDNS